MALTPVSGLARVKASTWRRSVWEESPSVCLLAVSFDSDQCFMIFLLDVLTVVKVQTCNIIVVRCLCSGILI